MATALAAPAEAEEVTAAAQWALAMLGVGVEELPDLAAIAGKRPVELAIVGQSGVSPGPVSALLVDGNTLVHHGCADPGSNTHDTQEARVILEITRPLGVQVHVHCFQAAESFADVARTFREAAGVADVVVTFQSFWGPDAALITKAIRESPQALVLSPYVEHGGNDTRDTPQGHAAKPWDKGSIGHFATVIPLARRSGNGKLLNPSARSERDTEVINFIAPSYHASGPGGTCPSAAVAVAMACYVYGAQTEKPAPDEVIERLRRTARLDRAALTSMPPFDDAAIDTLGADVRTLIAPPEGGRRTLDAEGVLHLGAVYRELEESRSKGLSL